MSNRLASLRAIAIFFFLIIPITRASAESVRQFAREFHVGKSAGAIFIIGYERDARDIEKLIDMAVTEAKRTFTDLDWQNPASEIAKLNASSGKGEIKVSDNTVAILKAAERVSEWTHGAFDVSYASPSGNYSAIKINDQTRTIAIKKNGLQIRLDPIMDGFLADLMVRIIYAAGMQNTLVKMGNVFRGLGRSLHGPWKIQVQDDAGTYAHRALNLTVNNSGMATISQTDFRATQLYDPRSKNPVVIGCRGVTMIMNEAALAQGLARAIMVLGPVEGTTLMTKLGNVKGLIVDNAGKFIRSPGF